MKDKRNYLFIGVRPYCLQKMMDLGLNVENVVTTKDSPLSKVCKEKKIKFKTIKCKQQLLDLIKKADFDILVSNGCPYILPISELRKGKELFVNIHPSLLPDLKGNSPVNGSILFNRPQGASCHIMDDGIDTGDIISQVKITNKPQCSLDVLYQLTFLAEAKCFELAHKNNFKVTIKNKKSKNCIYYTRKVEDRIITKKDDINIIYKKVKAFAVEGQFAYIINNNNIYNVTDIELIKTKMFDNEKHKINEIIQIYKNNVIVYENESVALFRLDNVEGLKIGTKLI